MTPLNGDFFRVTGTLCGEFTGHRWIPLTKASYTELWCFLWSAHEQTLSKQSKRRWFETPSCSLWRHRNDHRELRMSSWYGSGHETAAVRLVTWFCYQLIAKPGNKTATVPWPDPYQTIKPTKCKFGKSTPLRMRFHFTLPGIWIMWTKSLHQICLHYNQSQTVWIRAKSAVFLPFTTPPPPQKKMRVIWMYILQSVTESFTR